MAIQLEERGQDPTTETIPPERRTTPGVYIWAFFGVVTFVLIAYTWGRWLFGGHATPSPAGDSDISTWMLVGIRAMEFVSVVTALFGVWWFVIKPWRRDGKPSFDGMLATAFLTAWAWQDVAFNYSQTWFLYNSTFFNLGCPQCFLPGWQAQNQTQAEPLLWAPMWYFFFALIVVMAMNWGMTQARRKWPKLGNFGLFALTFVIGMVIDFAIEIPYLRLGWYTISGADRSQSLFPNNYFQFPLHENLIAALYLATWASIRFFKNDKGEAFHERGITELKATSRKKNWLRFLAVVGAVNVAQFVTFNIPTYMFAIHADPFPDDVMETSYFIQDICGPGTPYACPDERVPIMRGPISAHATPDGTMVAPDGLPNETEKYGLPDDEVVDEDAKDTSGIDDTAEGEDAENGEDSEAKAESSK